MGDNAWTALKNMGIMGGKGFVAGRADSMKSKLKTEEELKKEKKKLAEIMATEENMETFIGRYSSLIDKSQKGNVKNVLEATLKDVRSGAVKGGDWEKDFESKMSLITGLTGDMSPEQKRVAHGQTLTRASNLRAEFNKADAFSNYNTIKRSEAGLKAAYELSISPDAESRIASDQALGVLFQKMLDPTSVVRESEYARTPEGAGMMNRIRGIFPQLQKGGLTLSDSDRKSLVTMATKLLDGAKVDMNLLLGRYEKLAEGYDVDSSLIFGDIKPFEISEDKPEKTSGGVSELEVFKVNKVGD